MKHVMVTAVSLALILGSITALGRKDEKPEMNQTTYKHTNRLINTLSPYLLQHAHNPVDWYPWEPEALQRAKRENKPIFLSIGYSACHWCHVMEHESFEDEEVAAYLNEHFISIKVDREERPDIDEIYMQATVSMTGHGGWPMSVFLTPDCVPFQAGTYYPKERFVQLITAIAKGWEENRDQIDQVAARIQSRLKAWADGPETAEGMIAQEVCDRAARTLAEYFDLEWGGMVSGRNKFPPSMAMELLLRRYQVTKDESLLNAVEITLDRMANGGIYDHLGGGICRYSTDPHWLVPHFEKMLYDQALVSSIYLDGYQVFGKKRYAQVAGGIFDYVIADLQSTEGGFYSTRDADSEGMEGKYYVWTTDEVRKILGKEDAILFCDYYDVTEKGNWFEHRGHAPAGPKNILNIKRDLEAVAKQQDLAPAELEKRLAGMRRKLLEVRNKRVPPGLDDKILTGWNGLMIASLAKGARVLHEPKYADAAAKAADFVLTKLRKDGRLQRTYRNGKANLTGYLSDYAFLIEGLLNLYEATFELKWLMEAEKLVDTCTRYYFDEQDGGFFFTASDGESLIARSKNPRDGAIPSGNSIQAHNLLRLAILLSRKDLRQQAESIFKALGETVERSPAAFERLLCALDFYYSKPKEIVLTSTEAQDMQELINTVYSKYLPNKVVAGITNQSKSNVIGQKIPLLSGKTAINGLPTVYVCENYTCKSPVQSAAKVEALLWSVPKKN